MKSATNKAKGWEKRVGIFRKEMQCPKEREREKERGCLKN